LGLSADFNLRHPTTFSLLLSLFFFSYHRDHLDLHSFPTRRSSDLLRRAKPGRRDRERGYGARAPRHDLRGDHGPPRETPRRVRRDRKSTRLNSSHVAISYAVFCLKKKKTKHYVSSVLIAVKLRQAE